MFPSRVARRKTGIFWSEVFKPFVLDGMKNLGGACILMAILVGGLLLAAVAARTSGLLAMTGICKVAFGASLDCRVPVRVADIPPLSKELAGDAKLPKPLRASGRQSLSLREERSLLDAAEALMASEGSEAFARQRAGLPEREGLVLAVRRAEDVRLAVERAPVVDVFPWDSFVGEAPATWFVKPGFDPDKAAAVAGDHFAGLSYLAGVIVFFLLFFSGKMILDLTSMWRRLGEDDPSMATLAEADAIDSAARPAGRGGEGAPPSI